MILPALPTQAAQCVPWGIELSPRYGPPGTQVTISGHDFDARKYVDIYFNGALIAENVTTDASGDFAFVYTIPELCTGYYKVVADVVGHPEVDTYFHITPGLTVNPQKGAVGTTVMVKGRGFAKNEEGIELMYYTGDSYQTIEPNIKANAKGSWETSFQIPESPRGKHRIDAQGAVSRHFEVKDAIFTVTPEIRLDKLEGVPGDIITVSGSRFGAYEKSIRILFNGAAMVTEIKANSKGEWQASFRVPEMPAGKYSVAVEGQWTNKEDVLGLTFEINAYIELSAEEGYVGMEMTVTGRGFVGNQTVDITYDGELLATALTDEKGRFEACFSIPEGKYGEHRIAAEYGGENHANSIFILESEPPDTPILRTPAGDSRLGLMGSVTPAFEWSEVFDDSGVRYRLQVATSADFATSSIIASVTLSGTSYTLTEALPAGKYYWRVQTVDRAENESPWSLPRSFCVGLLPRWAFIAIIAVVAVIFILLIRAAIIRRRYY